MNSELIHTLHVVQELVLTVSLLLIAFMFYKEAHKAGWPKTDPSRALMSLMMIFSLCALTRFASYVLVWPMVNFVLVFPLLVATFWFVVQRDIVKITHQVFDEDAIRATDAYRKAHEEAEAEWGDEDAP